MKILLGKPNEWADKFYRLTEDYIYGVITIQKYYTELKSLNLNQSTIENLIDSMTNPPAIDYTE